MPTSARVNDPSAVARDYATEERFLARRLTTWATLDGPSVEEAAIATIAELGVDVVLEVGSGTGDFTERVQREVGVPVTAVDLSPRMAALTQARGVAAAVSDIVELPFRDGAFGCVLANRVLYHLPDPGRGCREIVRALRPGGCLVAIGYAPNHCGELYDLLGPRPAAPPDVLDQAIETAFAVVKTRQIVGRAVFRNREAVLGALRSWGEYAWFAGIDLDARVPPVAVPFTATYRHELLIATAPTPSRARGDG